MLTDVTGGPEVTDGVAIDSQGRIVVRSGPFSQQQGILERYDSNGDLDPSFGGSGWVPVPVPINPSGVWWLAGPVHDDLIAIGANDTIVTTGLAPDSTGVWVPAVARYTADGSPDSTFGGTGLVYTPFYDNLPYVIDTSNPGSPVTYFRDAAGNPTSPAVPLGLAVDAAGRVVLAAYFDAESDVGLLRYNADGALDNAFDRVVNPASDGSTVSWMALQTDDKVILGAPGLLNSSVGMVRSAGPSHLPQGTTVSLTSSASDPNPADAQSLAYTWSVAGPAGYTLPAGTSSSQPDFQFTPDVPGTYVVSLTVGEADPGDATTTVRTTFVVDPVSSTSLAAVLPQSNTTPNALTIQASAAVPVNALIDAVNGLAGVAPGGSIDQPVTITLVLNDGTYDDAFVHPPANVTLIIDGANGANTFVGHSPALTLTGGTVVIRHVTFSTPTNSPTIVVTGGSLTLRDDVIQESTGFAAAAISITGGTVDLGTAADPGGNVLNINGAGAFALNTTATPIAVVGDTFTVNGFPLTPSSLSGTVFEDFNDDGQIDFGEKGISGVAITLTGKDDLGNAINLSQTTDADGAYVFLNLRPGSYRITEAQPAGHPQGIDTVGTAGGSLAATDQIFVQLAQGIDGLNYNFGEQPPTTGAVKKGQSAGIGFWNNKNGQALILALNGGTGHQLADWLAATMPNTFGVHSGSNNLTGKSNAFVAALFQQDFLMKGVKLDAQVLATALSVYATDATLDSTGVAAHYGFTVSGTGLGTDTINVGSNGDAFGAANNANMAVLDLLVAMDAQAVNGVLYGGNLSKRNEANSIFSALNEAGNIS